MAKKIRDYESDVTRLLRELLERSPEMIEDQRTGRARWWDRKLDLEMLRRQRESTVPQKPYVYDSDAISAESGRSVEAYRSAEVHDAGAD
jgi:hypothetical protein